MNSLIVPLQHSLHINANFSSAGVGLEMEQHSPFSLRNFFFCLVPKLQLMIYNRRDAADVSKLLLSEAGKHNTTTDIQIVNVADCLDRIHSYSCGKADLMEELKLYMADVCALASLDSVSRFGLQLFW